MNIQTFGALVALLLSAVCNLGLHILDLLLQASIELGA